MHTGIHIALESVYRLAALMICLALVACSTTQPINQPITETLTTHHNGIEIRIEHSRAPQSASINTTHLRSAEYLNRHKECVLLIHGLARSTAHMGSMRNALDQQGFMAIAIDYPSTRYPIERLADAILPSGISACRALGASRIHLVTHSMGGIVARQYLKHNDVQDMGRLVMLAPPNQGSELIDFYRDIPGFEKFLGPAATQLGTDRKSSLPLQLGPVNVDTGIITGSVSSNSLMSLTLPGKDDGKVTTASTRVTGMCAQIILPTSHRMIMKDKRSIHEVIQYLTDGEFSSPKAAYFGCPTSTVISAGVF